MTKFFLITVLILITLNTISAQDNLLNATRVIDITKKTNDELSTENDKPLDYGYVNKRDILWSKIVWEFIDINQKINLPYFFPIKPINTASHLKMPTFSLNKKIEKIVVNIGAAKEILTTVANGNSLKAINIATSAINPDVHLSI